MKLRLQYYIRLQEVALLSLGQAEVEVGRIRMTMRKLDQGSALHQRDEGDSANGPNSERRVPKTSKIC